MSDSVPVPEVTVNTTLGSFNVELYPTFAPKTCKNFVELARRGCALRSTPLLHLIL